MIVECEKCSVRFQLDDSKVPTKGIRVRCSRCKHAFFLQPPGAPAEDAIHEIAADAATAGGRAVPPATEDLAARSGAEDDEESDWEFNEDIPGGEESDSAELPGLADEAVSETAPATDVSEDFAEGGLDSIDLDPGDLGSESVELDDPGEQEETFGSSEDFSGAEPDADAAVGEDALEEVRSLLGDDASPEDELGEPESWDFFGPEGPPVPGPVAERIPFEAEDSASSLDVAPVAVGTGPAMDAAPPSRFEPGPLGRMVRGVGHAVGWGATLAIAALGLAHGLLPGLQPASESPAPVRVGALVAEGIETHWIDTARSGAVLAVSGELRNPGARPARPSGAIQIVLLDGAGQPLDPRSARASVPLEPMEIRELPIEALLLARDEAAAALARTPVPARGSRRFQALFTDVPSEVGSVRLEIGELDPIWTEIWTEKRTESGTGIEAETETAGDEDAEGAEETEEGEPTAATSLR